MDLVYLQFENQCKMGVFVIRQFTLTRRNDHSGKLREEWGGGELLHSFPLHPSAALLLVCFVISQQEPPGTQIPHH